VKRQLKKHKVTVQTEEYHKD